MASNSGAVTNFFDGCSGFLGSLGRGWYPATGGGRGISPFWRANSDAGKEVTVPRALQQGAVWACVRKKAEIIASLPLSVYQVSKSGKRSVARDYPLYSILHDRPNGWMTAFDFISMQVASIDLWGNAYSRKVMSSGVLVALNPLRPEFTTPYQLDTGEIRFAFARGDEVDDFSQDEILHVKGFGVDGLVGMSPIAMARQTIGRSIGTDEAASKIFQSGLTASGFIKYAQTLKADQREQIRSSIQQFTGSSNMGKVMVLENGMDYTGITMNPADAQMLESRRFNIEELCRWFGMPPQLIGHTDKASSWASSLEGMNLQFLTYTLAPLLRSIEQVMNTKLIDPAERGRYFVKFNVNSLLRGDSAARAALYASAIGNSWMTPDEVRSLEDLDSVAGANQLLANSTMLPLDKLGQARPGIAPQGGN
ncbi:MAG: phage portal protein [Dyella sp.]